MTRQEEIKAVMAQRDELNRRLRELKDAGLLESGKAKICRRQTYAYRNDELFNLCYEVQMQSNGGKKLGTHFRTLFIGTRKECINEIPRVIADLQGLFDAAMEEENAAD